jgi:hypothetical protein
MKVTAVAKQATGPHRSRHVRSRSASGHLSEEAHDVRKSQSRYNSAREWG